MRKNLLFLLVSGVLAGTVLHAQKNYQPGFITLENGEQKSGLIDYRNWEKNPKVITFKASAGAAEEEFTVHQLSSFEVTGADIYKKAVVWKDDQPVILEHLEVEARPFVSDTVFLRLLVSGEKLNLYELLDTKYHFFVESGIDTLQELLFRKLLVKSDSYDFRTYFTFREQLKKYATGASGAKAAKMIDRASYVSTDLARIVTLINGSSGKTSREIGPKVRKIQFFAGGGASYNTIDFSGELLNMLHESPQVGYMAAGGVDFYSGRRFQNLFLRGEIRLSSSSYQGEGEVAGTWAGSKEIREYELQMMHVSPSVTLNYTVLRLPAFRLYLGLGSAYNFTSASKNTYTFTNGTTHATMEMDDFLEIEKKWIDFHFNAGVVVGRKMEARLLYRLDGSFINYSTVSAENKMTGLMLAYRF